MLHQPEITLVYLFNANLDDEIESQHIIRLVLERKGIDFSLL